MRYEFPFFKQNIYLYIVFDISTTSERQKYISSYNEIIYYSKKTHPLIYETKYCGYVLS